jgi:hypothetical protein
MRWRRQCANDGISKATNFTLTTNLSDSRERLFNLRFFKEGHQLLLYLLSARETEGDEQIYRQDSYFLN